MKRITGILISSALFMAGCSQTASVSSAGGETAAVQTQPKLEILEDQDHSDYSRAAEQKIQMHGI